MRFAVVLFVIGLVRNASSSSSSQLSSVYAKNIFFNFYDEIGEVYRESSILDSENFSSSIRDHPERFAIIVHGWRESCKIKWAKMLIENLNIFRGGLILCMDYSYFASEESYFRLVNHFDGITTALKIKLTDLESAGYDANNGYLFGFSFGGQVVVEAGRRFGFRKLKEIDTCDMAGPGFDNRPTSDHSLAAKNVQCIHTSRDKGTRYSLCHQDWKMGNCGNSQDAAGRPPLGSHGLCPYFYNSAFKHPFYAVPKPRNCRSKVPAADWPKKFKMGYTEERKSSVRGELYALTSKSYPYNVVDSNRVRYRSNFTQYEYDIDYIEYY